jgi:hypothetical protein
MSAYGAPHPSVYVHHARLRGAPDGLRARQRLEAALADLSPSSLGLPPQALLVVRKVAPKERLRLDRPGRDASYGRAARAELRSLASRARRPWLHPDAAQADAVLVADEAELMACLIRDWRRGTLPGCWWRTAAPGSLSAPEWWRRNLLPRGELLPAVTALLAEQGEAVAWMAHLTGDEARRAAAAAMAAHGLTLTTPFERPASRADLPQGVIPSNPLRTGFSAPAADFLASDPALRRLEDIVPELRRASLVLPQSRLLALTLALQRAPAWTRREAFQQAWRALDYGATIPVAGQRAEPGDFPADSAAGTRAVSFPEAAGFLPKNSNLEDGPPRQETPRTALLPTTERAGASSDEPTEAPTATGEHQSGRIDAVKSGPAADGNDRAMASDPCAPSEPRPPPSAEPQADRSAAYDRPELRLPRTIETRFGGIFYLLNVALALGLYGDFTQPLKPGIALSPWNWLALLGRAWFGRAFERDPVWRLLAELAGSSPGSEPGREFAPSEVWQVPDEWLAPWGKAGRLRPSYDRRRLRVWHPAGFALLDAPRRMGPNPLRQASALLGAGSRPLLGSAIERRRFCRSGLQTATRQPPPRGLKTAPTANVARWLDCLLPYLVARLQRALGATDPAAMPALVCRHPARVYRTAAHLDIHLSLAGLPIELRIAGLDRDPGWIPAAGRTIAFHFE